MWVVLRGGHVAAVAQDQHDASKMCVRFWNREDMKQARRTGLDGRAVGPLNSDYPYRIVCEPYEAASWLAQQVYDIDYCKFKPTVDHHVRGGETRSKALLDVFWVFWDNLRDEPVSPKKGWGNRGKKRGFMAKGIKVNVRSWLDRPAPARSWDSYTWTAADEAALNARLGMSEGTE